MAKRKNKDSGLDPEPVGVDAQESDDVEVEAVEVFDEDQDEGRGPEANVSTEAEALIPPEPDLDPHLGSWVVVRGLESNGKFEHPGVVTSSKEVQALLPEDQGQAEVDDQGPAFRAEVLVNVVVFLDGGGATALTDIPVFDDREAVDEYKTRAKARAYAKALEAVHKPVTAGTGNPVPEPVVMADSRSQIAAYWLGH